MGLGEFQLWSLNFGGKELKEEEAGRRKNRRRKEEETGMISR